MKENSLEQFTQQLNDFLLKLSNKLLLVVIILAVGFIFVKITTKAVKKLLQKSERIDHTTKTFIVSVVRVTLYFILAVTMLATVGINVTSIFTALGAAIITAGFAIQDTLANFVSGLIILVTRPFCAGDMIEFQDEIGKVQSINVFYTTLYSLEDRIVKIPNSSLTKNNVTNRVVDGKLRMFLRYNASYDDDIDLVKNVIQKQMESCDKILSDPAPAVCLSKHLDNGVEYLAKFWIEPDDYFTVYYFMQENVKRGFDENGITIPYPHIIVKK